MSLLGLDPIIAQYSHIHALTGHATYQLNVQGSPIGSLSPGWYPGPTTSHAVDEGRRGYIQLQDNLYLAKTNLAKSTD